MDPKLMKRVPPQPWVMQIVWQIFKTLMAYFMAMSRFSQLHLAQLVLSQTMTRHEAHTCLYIAGRNEPLGKVQEGASSSTGRSFSSDTTSIIVSMTSSSPHPETKSVDD
ncbi:hypothetical protein FBU30_008670 [Linnemannia zychae]|nr:hypothetical protein FBU30_008670 [Linnemannia zychae]